MRQSYLALTVVLGLIFSIALAVAAKPPKIHEVAEGMRPSIAADHRCLHVVFQKHVNESKKSEHLLFTKQKWWTGLDIATKYF